MLTLRWDGVSSAHPASPPPPYDTPPMQIKLHLFSRISYFSRKLKYSESEILTGPTLKHHWHRIYGCIISKLKEHEPQCNYCNAFFNANVYILLHYLAAIKWRVPTPLHWLPRPKTACCLGQRCPSLRGCQVIKLYKLLALQPPTPIYSASYSGFV